MMRAKTGSYNGGGGACRRGMRTGTEPARREGGGRGGGAGGPAQARGRQGP